MFTSFWVLKVSWINQGTSCTYLNYIAFTSFLEWNRNPEIADVAEKLYGNIEYLELYVGLQAEEAKPLVDGAGLCPGGEFDICEFE